MRILIALIFFASPCAAQDVVAGVLFSFEAGVICPPETVGTAPAPGTVAGVTNQIAEDPPFVSTGRRVPAVLGVGFGVKAMATDGNGIDNVTMRVTHPPMGPDKVTVQTFQTRISGLDPSLTFYQFDYSYEVLQGKWTMEAIKDDKTLYRTSFDVVPAQKLPELAMVCGFENMLSRAIPSSPDAPDWHRPAAG
jgi:hypothetical protein